MEKSSKIYVAGHRGMAGSAIIRNLKEKGYTNFVVKTHAELDLENQQATDDFFAAEKPDYVFLAAAKVGGLFENQSKPAEFINVNLRIQTNIIDAAYRNGVKKLMFLGSSCIYPVISDRLIKEEDLLTGKLEESNIAYAVAKIAGTQMCDAYRKQYNFDAVTIMPPNLIGPNDNFDPNAAHVAQGLMVRMHQAKQAGDKQFVVWGSGTPRREYLHVDDFAAAITYIMENKTDHTIYNIGTGEDHSIMELAAIAQKITGFEGEITTDPTKPDGTPRKTMNCDRLFATGWKPSISVEKAMEETYQSYLNQL